MFDLGDTLLYALSDWKETSWPSYKKSFFELLKASRLEVALDSGMEQVFSPGPSLRVLESLGHCDVLFTAGQGRIYISPPVLALLPCAGLPRAILCGSRSPETIISLQDIVQRMKDCELVVENQQRRDLVAPSRIEVRAESQGSLFRIAEKLDVQIQDPPTAWLLIAASAGLHDYTESLTWTEIPELNWPRADFDDNLLKFRPANDQREKRLSAYRNPTSGISEYRLWNGIQNAIVDLDWARFAVLASAGKTVLYYDGRSGELRVPATVPLPKLLSRGLSLISGRAPRRGDSGNSLPLLGRRMPVISFADIPPDVLETIRLKLGQPAVQGSHC